MFIQEALVVCQMYHPNIVGVFDFACESSGRLFLVFEFVRGIDLGKLLGTPPLPHAVIIFIVGEILHGLGHAHDLPNGGGVLGVEVQGVVHCDLSPDNILLSWRGDVKLADFGFAKLRTSSHTHESHDAQGKVAYMSPEQLNGEALDGRADLFSVGVMLWEMLTGERLFWHERAEAMVWRALTPITRPSVIRPVAPDLEAVVIRLLERDPARRYSSAEAALAALMACSDASRRGRCELELILLERFPEAPLARRAAGLPASIPYR